MSLLARRIALVSALAVSLLALHAAPAAAHERRTVGPYQLVVGFAEEPAFAGHANAVSLRVTDTRAGNAPVEGLERTLTVEVTVGGRSNGLRPPLRAVFGQPGTYAADLVPTRVGAYIFRFRGTIGSLEIDERFESGPGRFDEVRSAAALQYPERMLDGAELSARLDDLRASVDRSQLLAAAAAVLAGAALAVAVVRRRA